MNDPKIILQFINTAQNAGATVEKINSSPEILYDSLIKNTAGLKNVVVSEPQFIPIGLFDKFKENADILMQPDAAQLASAEAGITDAFAGVARTGSVCVSISSNLSNYISLLPRKHIVILESKNIVGRPMDIFERFLPDSLFEKTGWVFISGPSATADMGELVRGVHGPDKLHIILLD